MRISSLLFCMISLTSVGQTLNRQLYERYFKDLYTYEPAMIRENKIESIETELTEIQKDSITFQKLKDKTSFRKDGRPINAVSYTDFHRDSIMTEFSYDSLGNLIEYKQWKKDRYNYATGINEITKIYFEYNDGDLSKVSRFSMQEGQHYSTLDFCDTITYSLNKENAIILRGKATNGAPANSDKSPKFIDPPNKIEVKLTATENLSSNKPLDKESCWNSTCNYTNDVVKQLQQITGKRCIPEQIITYCANAGGLEFGRSMTEKADTVFKKTVLFQGNRMVIDTIGKRIYLKDVSFNSIPTSMENRDIQTQATHQYDFSFYLLQSEILEESSRGQREHSKDSSITTYDYYTFGLQKTKITAHFRSYLMYENGVYIYTKPKETDTKIWHYSPVIIFEEKTRFETWE